MSCGRRFCPGLSDTYDPDSSNDCAAGWLSCVTVVVNEMEQRFRPLAKDCSNHAVFALTYLRVTRTYKWSAEQRGYYADPGWMTHAVAVFAKYYLRAYDTWKGDPSSAAVPEAWRIAFTASKNGQVSGSGNLMLGRLGHQRHLWQRSAPRTRGAAATELRYPNTISPADLPADRLPVLLDWHTQDPVSQWERHRNAAIHARQGNRNPFIDHPEWAAQAVPRLPGRWS